MLWRIADDHGLTTGALIEANALDPAEPLYPGQELQIPGGAGGAEDASAGAQWYTVQEGDTLVSIGLQFGISTDTLIEINALSDPDLVVPGQVLQVG
jgi:N-acetylmuramoyl-L-alanine amidase